MAKKIFIAATLQNDGKTTLGLGLIAVLKKHFSRIGFIKPIGQRYLIEQGYKVDEDSVLIEKVFKLKMNLKDMSPIAIEKGFTEHYILKNGQHQNLDEMILNSFEKVAYNKDLVIIEGTGHAGVGSCFDHSNARVAKLLEAPVITVAPGGVGRPIDEVMLNKTLFDKEGVETLGVVVNKVDTEKFEKVNRLVRLGFEQKGIRTLGVLPYHPRLSMPTTREILEEVKIELIAGYDYLDTPVDKVVICAMKVKDALPYITPNSLVITPGDREDILKHIIKKHRKKKLHTAGIILTGGFRPSKHMRRDLEHCKIPVLLHRGDTYSVAEKIHDLHVKTKPNDQEKIRLIFDLIEKHIDIDAILRCIG